MSNWHCLVIILVTSNKSHSGSRSAEGRFFPCKTGTVFAFSMSIIIGSVYSHIRFGVWNKIPVMEFYN